MTTEQRYAKYKRWCVKHDLPFTTQAEYEKQLKKIPEKTINNVDLILMGSNRRKDRHK